jgi:hypothetical protein
MHHFGTPTQSQLTTATSTGAVVVIANSLRLGRADDSVSWRSFEDVGQLALPQEIQVGLDPRQSKPQMRFRATITRVGILRDLNDVGPAQVRKRSLRRRQSKWNRAENGVSDAAICLTTIGRRPSPFFGLVRLREVTPGLAEFVGTGPRERCPVYQADSREDCSDPTRMG